MLFLSLWFTSSWVKLWLFVATKRVTRMEIIMEVDASRHFGLWTPSSCFLVLFLHIIWSTYTYILYWYIYIYIYIPFFLIYAYIYVYMYHLLIYVLYTNWCRLNSVNKGEPYGKILQLTCPYCQSWGNWRVPPHNGGSQPFSTASCLGWEFELQSRRTAALGPRWRISRRRNDRTSHVVGLQKFHYQRSGLN